jgi:hypothetical protein
VKRRIANGIVNTGINVTYKLVWLVRSGVQILSRNRIRASHLFKKRNFESFEHDTQVEDESGWK